MTPNEVIRLFHFNPEQRIQPDELADFHRMLFVSFRDIEYDFAKKILIKVIGLHGKKHPKIFYPKKVFKIIQDGEIEASQQKARGRHVPSPKKSL